ncbi:hypothetical protein BTJ68_11187 [Hortaea werneckii EXF-2000]|uniref:Uncharacterized protein n=1 Tax=Hortaea werneckii EXF-2000 TaxID=1157616 RepID=A0A1Z5SY67_HORWE|nr:hypothetical protein BTJ68_11187 [Hortaea werneckii EXF-2000]
MWRDDDHDRIATICHPIPHYIHSQTTSSANTSHHRPQGNKQQKSTCSSRRTFGSLQALAALAYAQDDSECDPENDDNNNATCTSSSMGTMTQSAAAQSTTQSTTDSAGNPLIVTVPVSTTVDTNVISSTSMLNSNIQSSFVPIVETVSSSVSTNYVPESLATSSSVAVNTFFSSSTVPVVINTLENGSVTTSTQSMTGSMTMSTSTGGSGGAAGADSDSSSSSSGSDSGAMPTGAPKYALGGVAAAVFGLAAL